MTTIVIGIDPGITGAIAVFMDGKFYAVYDMPSQVKSVTRKRSPRTDKMVDRIKKEVDCHALYLTVSSCVLLGDTFISLEAVHAMRKGAAGETQGTVSAFSFGESFGCARAVCEATVHKNHINRISPTVWKRHFGLLKQDKDAARLKAIDLVPDAAGVLTRKKDGGRADAILLAKYLVDNEEKMVC